LADRLGGRFAWPDAPEPDLDGMVVQIEHWLAVASDFFQMIAFPEKYQCDEAAEMIADIAEPGAYEACEIVRNRHEFRYELSVDTRSFWRNVTVDHLENFGEIGTRFECNRKEVVIHVDEVTEDFGDDDDEEDEET
jgi:hypothetical protein